MQKYVDAVQKLINEYYGIVESGTGHRQIGPRDLTGLMHDLSTDVNYILIVLEDLGAWGEKIVKFLKQIQKHIEESKATEATKHGMRVIRTKKAAPTRKTANALTKAIDDIEALMLREVNKTKVKKKTRRRVGDSVDELNRLMGIEDNDDVPF